MSGHNKWSKIQHKKGANDSKRSALFTKIIREITMAARTGGGDPNGNPRLRLAIQNAKGAHMPGDNIDRAIKRGTGQLEGVDYQEIRFEGYGPGGVAFIIDCLTDNKNRTTSEVRHLLSKYGGNLGTTGCVAHQFNRRGVIEISAEKDLDEDKLLEDCLDIEGFEDAEVDGSSATVYTEPSAVSAVSEALTAKGYPVEKAEAGEVATVTQRVEGKSAETVLKLYDLLEEHDDVQKVHANFDIPDEVWESYAG